MYGYNLSGSIIERVFENNNMKIFTLIIILSFISLNPQTVFSDAGLTANIELALRAGNAKELAKLFSSNIDLNIPGNEGVYSKAQAELILKDFFSKYPPKSYATLHKGTSSDGAMYTIGNLVTSKGTFRAYFYIKKTADKYYIHEFSLNVEENDK